MNKRNYSAWQIDSREFNTSLTSNEKLLYFARYAILAPSGHNSQPWLLTPAHESLLLTVNPDHHLSADGSGLLSVEPFISLGTFVETFVSAARGFGYMVNVTLFPEKHVVAKLQLGEICEAEPSLLNAIVRRVSNRNPFETQPLHTDILQRLVSRCPSGVAAHTVTTQKDIAFINEQTSAAIRSIMGKQAYRNELSTWVRGNLTRRFDGMPGFTHGFGLAASLMAKMAVKRGASPGAQVKKANSLIKILEHF
ncbi:hypothetical protein IPL68_00635 [Candidatus Saccharibacteria bacterium]|nr:MAG: hypothetical protein IPL68_00635 [Candidatus Saccharibacteria bacterium]